MTLRSLFGRTSAARMSLLSIVFAAAILILLFLTTPTSAVDRNKFRTCQQTDFCKRLRNAEKQMMYRLEPSALVFDAPTATFTLPVTSATYPGQPPLDAKLTILADGIVRFFATESHPKHPRHPVQDVLQPDAVKPFSGEVKVDKQDAKVTAKWTSKRNGQTATQQNELIIQLAPFQLTFLVDSTTVLLVNSQNLLAFEQYRDRNPSRQPPSAPMQPTVVEGATEEQQAADQAVYQAQLETYNTELAAFNAAEQVAGVWPHDTAGAWEESHGSHTDHKVRGPAAIGLDIAFVNSRYVYGIPEHASSFALKNTVQLNNGAAAEYHEPYRLYNLDVFEFELNEPMALYGAVPYVMSHTQDGKYSTGMLWLNPSETYVDIAESGSSSGLLTEATYQKHIHWMSETGVLDAFFLLGSQPSDLFLQYSSLTGFPFLPPQFSIGYHQCRWNYKSQEDVAGVDSGFDEHDIPYDVIWLDIEHTDSKKYFTWDRTYFSDPTTMQNSLAVKGRKMVTIVDPHIKRDSGYNVHTDATALGHYVKNKGSSDYEGWCWPGSSSYLDFFQSKVRDFWAAHYAYSSYEGSTPNLFIWNDMNEPSVFNGPEVTMPKDNIHRLDGIEGQVEHREVHNQYGAFVHKATAQGLVERDVTAGKEKQRPFVLTRSFFAGSQRSAAVWTGDNAAKWDHLKSTAPMLLSLAVGQIPFSGADVGGFFGDPDAQLLTRWFQAGAFQPFFRGHAHIDSKRREPWLFGEPYTSIIRQAIRTRYSYLPYLYTLFYLNSVTGMPIMRPLWIEFPADEKTYGLEDQWLLGDALLIKPIVDPDVTTTLVYLPSTGANSAVKTFWYDLQNDAVYPGGDTVNVVTPLQHIPVFQRGGTIVAKRERARRSSSLMIHDPYTLVIALSGEKTASGRLFIDDRSSYQYQNGAYVFVEFTLKGGLLSGVVTNPNTSFQDANTIERIVIIGGGSAYTSATIVSGKNALGQEVTNQPLAVQAQNGGKRLVIRKPDVMIAKEWKIQLQ